MDFQKKLSLSAPCSWSIPCHFPWKPFHLLTYYIETKSITTLQKYCRRLRTHVLLTEMVFHRFFFKIGVLKNFESFSEKELFWSLSLNVQAWRPAKEIPTQLFSLNFAKFLRTQFLQNNSSGSFFPHFATYFRSMPPFYTPLKASKYLWLSG